MSEFSNLLTGLITQKEIKVYSMAKYCKLDRSTMYKIMNDSRRPPAEDVFNKMAEFMHLTPSEYRDFRQAYDITLIGDELYYHRKNIEDFILSFPDFFSPQLPVPDVRTFLPQKEWKDGPPVCSALNSAIEVEHALYHMILAESQKKDGKIALLLPPDYSFLFGLLTGQISSAAGLRIDHIFCLGQGTPLTEKHESYHILYLKKLLPLYASALDYHPYYFYDNIPSHYYSFNGFPCIILTENSAIACTSDYNLGMFCFDPGIVSMLWKLFRSYQEQCFPLFHVVDSVLEECTILGNLGWENSSWGIQPEPCTIPYITEEILEAAVYPELPGREMLMPHIWNYIENARSWTPNKNLHLYHTPEGIRHFARTGRITEVPENLYRPLTPEERKFLLTKLHDNISQSGCRLLKKPLTDVPVHFHLCVNETSGYLLFRNIRGDNVYLIIQEPGFLADMQDYIKSLDDRVLAAAGETAEFIQQVIDEIR